MSQRHRYYGNGRFSPPPEYFQQQKKRNQEQQLISLGAGSAITYVLYKGYNAKTNTAKILFTAGGLVPLFFVGGITQGLGGSFKSPIFDIPVLGNVLAGATIILSGLLPKQAIKR